MTYDNYGNICSKNGKNYLYDSKWKDLLIQVGDKSIFYDDQGNPYYYLDHNFPIWGKGRQMMSFVKEDDNYTELYHCDYTYNANGIRTSKTVNNIRHDYLLEGTKILRETWQNKTLIPLYDNQDQVCGISYNGNLFSFLKNLQGDVIALVDETGETVARYSYDAWGVPTILEDHTDIQITNVNPYLYRTYYYDREIGMYYLQSRYYDPTIGRFINTDDAEFVSMDENLFQYCYNSPVIYEDAYGYSPGVLYTSPNEAAYFFANEFFAITLYIYYEVGGLIYSKQRDGKTYYSYTNHVWKFNVIVYKRKSLFIPVKKCVSFSSM